ncbi:glycoside hydrolase superfamily [Schizophyllum commune]
MPDNVPNTTDGWWCDYADEYAFVGFSYEVTACQSLARLTREFKDIRTRFNGRYVRLYGACDRENFYDDVVEAAWEANVGVHALVWFGFDGTDEWKGRRDAVFNTIQNNPKARFVTRVLQFGSEPLYDWVLTPEQLATQVNKAKKVLNPLGVNVTISEMAYGYQEHDNAKPVMDAIDLIDAHMLPFFAQDTSTANKSWPLVIRDINWFLENGQGKKMYLSENGWPSETSEGVQPNSPDAVADVQNEQDYFALLDRRCPYFKRMSIGWFAHIYAEYMEPGYGVYGLKDGEKKGADGDEDSDDEFDVVVGGEGAMGRGGAYGLAGHGGKGGKKKTGGVGDLKIAFAPRTQC